MILVNAKYKMRTSISVFSFNKKLCRQVSLNLPVLSNTLHLALFLCSKAKSKS